MTNPLELLRLLVKQKKWALLEKLGAPLFADPKYGLDAKALVAYGLAWDRRPEHALLIAEQVIAAQPGHVVARYAAASALGRLNRKQDSRQHWAVVMQVAPTQQALLNLLARIGGSALGYEAAISAYVAHATAAGCPPKLHPAPISNLRDWAERNGVPLLEVSEPDGLPYKDPVVWPPAGEPALTVETSMQPFVADLVDVQIFGRSSIILTADGTALSETAGHPRYGHIADLGWDPVVLHQSPKQLLLNLVGYEPEEIEAGIYLVGQSSDAFGHWLPEFLSKLQYLQCHPDYPDRPIIVDADMPASHFEYLRRLAKNEVIKLPRGGSLRCRRLLVSPLLFFLPTHAFPHDIPSRQLGSLSPRALRFIRDNTTTRPAPPAGACRRRIFLGRKNLNWRFLTNEDEIAAMLAPLGFEMAYLETMNIDEQQALFSQAEWIVAPFGSALLNLVFAPTDVKLVVLHQANLHNMGSFQGPMEAMGYNPVFVCSDNTRGDRQANFDVAPQRLRQALAAMGLREAAE